LKLFDIPTAEELIQKPSNDRGSFGKMSGK
jgi:hypothetical protein